MKNGNKLISVILSAILLAVFILTIYIYYTYLSEYGSRRNILTLFLSIVGIGVTIIFYFLATKLCEKKTSRNILITVFLIIFFVPICSMYYPGRITYSRFGMSVYGLIPIPALDITVNSSGKLWFRDKSHYLSLEEVNPLLSSDVKVLVIGIGWHSRVEVDPAIKQLEGIEIIILSTPDAFDTFNEKKLGGESVVLVAHSTC